MKVTSINFAFSSQLDLKTGIRQRFTAICFKYRNFRLAIVSKLTLGPMLDKNGTSVRLLDPQHPTTGSDVRGASPLGEGCPFLFIVCETPALYNEGAWS
jgi:hypothetical protein